MRKIIAAFDGLDLSESTMAYAIYFARHNNAFLTGVFLDDITYHSYHFSDLVATEGGVSDRRLNELNAADKNTREEAADKFAAACDAAGLHYTVHHDKNVALQELLHESMYSDLLVIDKKETFTRYEEELPSNFITDLLSDVQCPVLVVPSVYRPVEKLVLLYDGGPSSVHAVKMFSYLLPVLKSERVEVLTVRSEEGEGHLPDNYLFKELMKKHFPNADYVVLNGNAEAAITDYLYQQSENLLVVTGAYRRSRVSRWFKRSMADHLMQKTNAVIFIAHNR